MPRLRPMNNAIQDLYNRFRGVRPKAVVSHIQKNLGAYRELNPEEVRSEVLAAMGKAGQKEWESSVNNAIFRLRNVGVLSRPSEEEKQESRRRASRKGMQARWGKEFNSDLILDCISRQLANGVDASDINSIDIADILQKEGKQIDTLQASEIICALRASGKLKPLSQKTRARIAKIVNQRNIITKEKKALSERSSPRSKATRVRAFIEAFLKLGFKSSEISPRKVFNELRDKVSGLKIDDVYTAITNLRDKKILPQLTPEERVANWRESFSSRMAARKGTTKKEERTTLAKADLGSRQELTRRVEKRLMLRSAEPVSVAETRIPSTDRAEKIRKLMEAREKAKQADLAIAKFQEHCPELRDVGDSKVFYTILRSLMREVDPHTISELLLADGFKVGIVDVACVSLDFVALLHKINLKELSDLVSQTGFWKVSPICRDIMANYILKFEIPEFVLMSRRLRALGQRV